MKIIRALMIAMLIGVVLTVVTVSALATQRPRAMPFGVTGSSSVVTTAQSANVGNYQVSFVNTLYANEDDVMNAINQGDIYGAYIPGTTSDRLLIVPSKSFFAAFVIDSVFEESAKHLGRPVTVEQVKPLPVGMDPFGVVVALLMLPLVVGGLLAAVLVFKATQRETQHWRVAILLGYSILGAFLTLVIAGPIFGAFASDRFWPLFLCAALIEVTVATVTAALIALLPGFLAMLFAIVLFLFVGLPVAGTTGASMLPPFWQAVGGAMPPRYGVTLMQNVLYFSSNSITTPILVLAGYAVVASAVLTYLEWLRPRQTAVPAGDGHLSQAGTGPRRVAARLVVAALIIVAVEQSLFAANYVSSGHNPVSTNMPFAVVGNSSLISAVPADSISVTSYPDQAGAQNAIDQGLAWGALIPGSGGTNTLLVVPSISDIAPLTLSQAFQAAAKSQGQTVTVQPYFPTPLASGDPYGIMVSLLLTPLLLCGTMSSTLLRGATGTAAGRYRLLLLIGFAFGLALVLDLIAGVWFSGIPSSGFWIAWPIMALTVTVVALMAAVLQRLLGAAGTAITVLIIILFGKPSSGGANGVPYLPAFWNDIGPYLPPRNAYVLLRNAIYFGGNDTAQALIVLLAYLVVLAVILGILDWYRRPAPELPITPQTEAESAVVAVPAGVAI
jgi:hypothetical protein